LGTIGADGAAEGNGNTPEFEVVVFYTFLSNEGEKHAVFPHASIAPIP